MEALDLNHISNLLVLAEGLKTIKDSQFDMTRYRADYSDTTFLSTADFISANDCGTVGCALGWAPLLVKKPKRDMFAKDNEDSLLSLNFKFYSREVFGMDDKDYNSHLWEYLFDSRWEKYDNTRRGAIKRLKEVAKNPDRLKWDLPWTFKNKME